MAKKRIKHRKFRAFCSAMSHVTRLVTLNRTILTVEKFGGRWYVSWM